MLRALLGAKWLPYAAIGAAALLGTASLWGYGKGFAAAETQYLKTLNVALSEQSKHLRAQTALAVEKERRKHHAHERVSRVRRVECSLSPECVRWTDDIMRAAHSDN